MKFKYRWILQNLLFPLVLFYYEVVFRFSTTHGTLSPALLPTFLFCLLYGEILYLLCSFIKNKHIHAFLHIGLFVLLALPFLVEFFVYRQFKVLYDVNTVIGGANDVAGGFMSDVFKLIFSVDGLSHIFLFLLPSLLYGIYAKQQNNVYKTPSSTRYVTVFLWAAIFILNLFFIEYTPIFSNAYRKQYSFPSAVSNFGLLTGIRLDITRNISGKDIGFNIVIEKTSAEEISAVSESESHTLISQPTYEKNVLDIDFEALSKQSDNIYAEMDAYVASLRPSSQNEYTGLFHGKNMIFITAEAFSAEIIDEKRTPTLYRLAMKGIQFTDYYQSASAGTIGGEFSNIFGMLPVEGGISFEIMAANTHPFTLGQQFNKLGYYGIAYHNNDYTYYSRNFTHNSLGYSEGFYGVGNGLEGIITEQWPESDLEMIQGTINTYIKNEPFNVYYMTVSGHSTYTDGSNAMAIKNQAAVADLTEYSDRVRNYYAANMELEYALSYLVNRLEEEGIADDTVIVIAADHFPYGLDNDAALGYMPYLSELYGYEVTNYLERDHNRLIIWSGCLEDAEPIVVDTPTSSIDILPTLSNLFGFEWDSRLLVGRDVFSTAEPLVFTLSYDWKTDKGTYLSSTDTFTPVSDDVTIPNGYVQRINAMVQNKLTFSNRILNFNYYAHLFE